MRPASGETLVANTWYADSPSPSLLPVAVSLASFPSSAGRIIRVNWARSPEPTEWTETAPLLPSSNSDTALLTVSVLTAGISQLIPLPSSRFIISAE